MHKLYLDSFMDMCNDEILSYGIVKKPSAKNVLCRVVYYSYEELKS